MNQENPVKKLTTNRLQAYRRASHFAERVGWPEAIPFVNADVQWQIAPNDSVVSASIEVRDFSVVAQLVMNYMGRRVNMVRLIFDGYQERSEGLLFRDDVQQGIVCFRSHLENMLHGPVKMPMMTQVQA